MSNEEKIERGLLAMIYRGDYGGATLNRMYRVQRVTLVGYDIAAGSMVDEVHQATVDAPAVRLGQTTPGYIVAFPGDKGDRWTMFGGTFIYSTDDRWPTRKPIPLHDRYEGDPESWPMPPWPVDVSSSKAGAERARRAVELVYPGQRGEGRIQDLVSDLCHLADAEHGAIGVTRPDTHALLDQAWRRYDEERE